MNDEQHKIVQELLKDIFNNVNVWLTHAEAKNAAIIAFNIASLSFVWSMGEDGFHRRVIYIICIGIVLSIIMALISFWPKTGKEYKCMGVHFNKDNLILYKDIAKYNKEEYIQAIFKQYMHMNVSAAEITKIEMDFSEEITYNSYIVLYKYKWFRYALITEIVMLVLLGLLLLI